MLDFFKRLFDSTPDAVTFDEELVTQANTVTVRNDQRPPRAPRQG